MPGQPSDVILKSRFIRAGAGAGKTTELIGTFLAFVREFKTAEGRFPKVVMTTFTRKATQEVKERLLVSALLAGEKEIFEYINKKSSVHISTIHGLLSIYLTQNAERLKLPREIRIIDDNQFNRILKKKINETLKDSPRYLELLESYSFNDLVSLAGKALEFKAQNPQAMNVGQAQLSAVADEKKRDIVACIEKILATAAFPDTWKDYSQWLQQLLDLLKQNRESDFFEAVELAPAKPRWSSAKPAFDPVAHALIEDLKDEKLKELFDSRSYIENHEKLNQLFLQLVQQLEQKMFEQKRQTGELTISDLETVSLRLLEEFPETAQDFSDGWDYFMIDEYQDTSPLQVKILNRIIRNKPCFVVGDPQQSIYLFRGARSEVFEQKQLQMADQGAEVRFLETNYRTEKPLMTFMNSYFSSFSAQFRPMIPKTSEPKKTLQHDVFFIRGKNQSEAALQQLQFLFGAGINPQDICVLSRSNSKLSDLALKAAKAGIPVQLQAAAGFEARREILDLMAFNRFLNNPHDDENLVTLIRSPWCYVEDEMILKLAQSPTAKSQSLWAALLETSHPQKERLLGFLNLFDVAGVLQANRHFIGATEFINSSVIYDKTGKREANIFKFLTNLAEKEKSPGFSLGLFLEDQFRSLQSDLGSMSSEAQPVQQPDCVSLMTVHAAKGLQYRHVLVLGFTDTPQLSKTPKLSFDEDTGLFSLSVLNEESGKHEASGWASQLRKSFNQRELLENERVLYVAMTRAIESLSLIAETDKRSISSSSWFKRTVWPEPGEVSADGYSALSVVFDEPVMRQQQSGSQQTEVRALFSAPASQGPQNNSVTDLLGTAATGGEADFQKGLLNLKKAQRGTDLHRLFEAVKYRDVEELRRDLEEKDRQSLDYLLALKELDMLSLIKAGNTEWGFGLQNRIQGQIDLWCETEDAVHVMDYKTGSPAFAEKAFEQLSVYTLALFQMKQISTQKKIIHSVIYPVEKAVKQEFYDGEADFKLRVRKKILEFFR